MIQSGRKLASRDFRRQGLRQTGGERDTMATGADRDAEKSVVAERSHGSDTVNP